MPYADIICANLGTKSMFYEFGDESLEELALKAFPGLNKLNSDIIVGSERLTDWQQNIRVCKWLAERIFIIKKPDILVKVNIKCCLTKRPVKFSFYASPTHTVCDVKEVVSAIMVDNEHLVRTNLPHVSDETLIGEISPSKIQLNFRTYSGNMEVFVRALGKSTLCLPVDKLMPIKTLKLVVQDKTGVSCDQQRLSFCGKELLNERTISSYNITNFSNLNLTVGLRGGDSASIYETCNTFVDVSCEKGPEKTKWAKWAPEWRRAGRGLCLEGFCRNETCMAYNSMVVMPMGDSTVYELGMPGYETNCPMCSKFVDPVTCGFNNCKWRYIGIKKTDAGCQRVKAAWETADDNYYRFDPNRHGKCQWAHLAIECRSLLDESEECEEKFMREVKKAIKESQDSVQRNKFCGICKRGFNAKNRVPLLLPCQHAFCSKCVSKSYVENRYGITCVWCKKYFRVEEDKLERAEFIIDFLDI